MRKFLATILLLAASLEILAAAGQVKLIRIEPTRDRGVDYLDIYTSADVKTSGLLADDQLVIELPGAIIAEDFQLVERPLKRVKAITIEAGADAVKIILTLKQDIDYDIVNVFGRAKSVAEINDRRDFTAELFAAWEKRNLASQGQAIVPEEYRPDPLGKDQSLKNKVIVIEPGHGGRDPGAIAKNKTAEKVLTLSTARKIAKRLSAAGAHVWLTRNGDRTCNLRDVAAFANAKKADLFLSMHYNYVQRDSITGTETYYYSRSSRKAALEIHRSLLAGLKSKDRGVRKAMFYTIHHTNMPAVLLEPAFLSHDRDAKLAGTNAFQDQLAQAVVKGVKNYF